jgi:hypothetical protein
LGGEVCKRRGVPSLAYENATENTGVNSTMKAEKSQIFPKANS